MSTYKLTTKDMTTHGGCQWTPGEWKETSGEGELCGPGWLHWYSSPLLAVLLNPIHAGYDPTTMRLWEAEVEGERKEDRGLKFGTTRGRIVREIPVPALILDERACIAIAWARAVLPVGYAPGWGEWADRYVAGADRTAADADAAGAAADTAAAAAAYAAHAAYGAAAYAAYATANSTDLDLHAIAEAALLAERKRAEEASR